MNYDWVKLVASRLDPVLVSQAERGLKEKLQGKLVLNSGTILGDFDQVARYLKFYVES